MTNTVLGAMRGRAQIKGDHSPIGQLKPCAFSSGPHDVKILTIYSKLEESGHGRHVLGGCRAGNNLAERKD